MKKMYLWELSKVSAANNGLKYFTVWSLIVQNRHIRSPLFIITHNITTHVARALSTPVHKDAMTRVLLSEAAIKDMWNDLKKWPSLYTGHKWNSSLHCRCRTDWSPFNCHTSQLPAQMDRCHKEKRIGWKLGSPNAATLNSALDEVSNLLRYVMDDWLPRSQLRLILYFPAYAHTLVNPFLRAA